MREILQLYRVSYDEDGTWHWWVNWQPQDTVVGEAWQNGTPLVIVEHVIERKWRKWPWSKPVLSKEVRRAFYKPDEIRYAGVSRETIVCAMDP